MTQPTAPAEARAHTSEAFDFERTSLSAEADGIVRDKAARDRVAGAQWAAQINRYLAAPRGG